MLFSEYKKLSFYYTKKYSHSSIPVPTEVGNTGIQKKPFHSSPNGGSEHWNPFKNYICRKNR